MANDLGTMIDYIKQDIESINQEIKTVVTIKNQGSETLNY